MQLHMSSFSVGELIQGSIGIYRDNVRKIIVYIQLILSFIKSLFKISGTFVGAHARRDLNDEGTNVTGTHSNIERMMLSSHEKFQAATCVWVSSCL